MAKKKTKDSKPQKLEHELIPEQRKLSKKEAEEIREKYKVETNDMPKISVEDPSIAHLDVEEGDIIEIIRNSPTAGETTFYRCVVRE